MIVYNELLGYEKYQIAQDPEMFHFSIDSMLLAHFATVNKRFKTVVDLCSGNCPIPMYLTLRTTAKIYAVEIQERAVMLANMSLEKNQLTKQITVLKRDVKDVNQELGQDMADLVLCNPPYFKLTETSNVNHNEELTCARHELLITLEDVIKEASLLLKEGGYFAMVHRPTRLVEILALLEKYHLKPSRLQFIYPKKQKSANHLLIEARKGSHKQDNLQVLDPIYVFNENNCWTNDILKIYNYKKEEE